MIFANLNSFSVIFSLAILIIVSFLLFFIFKRKIIENKIQIILILFSILFLLISTFEPKWWLENKSDNVSWTNIVFVLDVSKSMKALDFNILKKEISRLDYAKRFISDFIVNYRENNYWLNIFAWEILEVLPLTSDISLFNTVLSWITSENLSKNWTDVYSAIESSLSFFDSDNNSGLIVILSDGWDDEKLWNFDKIDALLKEKNLSLAVVWIWNKQGSYIPTWIDVFWKISYKTYKGKKVLTKLNEIGLRNLASDLSWKYYTLDKNSSLNEIQNNINSSIEKIIITKDILSRQNLERYFIFLSFICFLLYLFYPFLNKINLKIWKK